MTVATDGVDRLEQIELRQQAHYWQAQHARAVQREAEIQKKQKLIETLKAKVVELTRQVFGRKTEGTGDDSSDKSDSDKPGSRGQQERAPGHGRKCLEHLPSVERIHELPEAKRCCPACGKPFRDFPGTEDSEEIEWEVILRRGIHKRRRYQPTSDCPALRKWGNRE